MAELTTIAEITGEIDISAQISKLKSGRLQYSPENTKKYPTSKIESRQFIDIENHKIFDNSYRPDRIVELDGGTTIETVNRIGIPFQKRIVNTAVAFAFGNSVNWTNQNSTPENKKYFDSFLAMLKYVKYDSIDKLMCKSLKTYTESAELFFTPETAPHSKYGFSTNLKLKCTVLSPDNCILYPFFDIYGDMIAFSREYTINESGSISTYFDIYTKDEYVSYVLDGKEYLLRRQERNLLGKIPVVYISQPQTEFFDVQSAIDRLELLLSNHAETNDFHSSPTLFMQGELGNMVKKGEQGKLITGQVGSKLEYVTWNSAPESVKLEIENLFKIIFEFTQTPNFSFESVKGLGAVSGVALKLLFLDAHLKVVHDRVIYDSWMERRKSIIISFLGLMDNANKSNYESLEIEHEIRPYMIDDRKALIEELSTANGNKPLMSQLSSIQLFGVAIDAESELKQIQDEEKQANTSNLFAPVQ